MKTTYPLLALAILTLSGCVKTGESIERTTNSNFSVELLFEKDAVRVYRFRDAGRYVYYTDARGKTEWTTTRRSGKTSVQERHQVETVE